MSSTYVLRRWAIPLAVLLVSGWTYLATATEEPSSGEPKTVVDALKAAGNYKTLVELLHSSGVDKTLGEKGPYTLFAPTDEAFANLPKATLDDLRKPENKDKLARTLRFHIVVGQHLAVDVERMKSAKTLEGGELMIEVIDGKIHVNGALVTKTDAMAENGVIHSIDTVLIPKEQVAGG